MSNTNNKNSSLINGCDTHIVLKMTDIEKYCNQSQINNLKELCETVSAGRTKENKKNNIYYVCNIDEPYADTVHDIILTGEENKKNMDIEEITK